MIFTKLLDMAMLEKGVAVSGCIHLIPILSILYCNGNRIGDFVLLLFWTVVIISHQ